MAVEAIIPIGSDGAGQKKVRNISVDVLQPDGTTATVMMQVLAVYDENGQPYTDANPLPASDGDTHKLLVQMCELLTEISAKLSE